MRGLEYYVINGVAGGVVRGTVKNEILSFNVRNIIKSKTHDKIPFRVFLKAYGDLGYAYNRDYGNSIFNNQLLRTWGAGIDIISFYDVARTALSNVEFENKLLKRYIKDWPEEDTNKD